MIRNPFTAARACGVYEGALRESVLLLKRQPYLSSTLLEVCWLQTARRTSVERLLRELFRCRFIRNVKASGFQSGVDYCRGRSRDHSGCRSTKLAWSESRSDGKIPGGAGCKGPSSDTVARSLRGAASSGWLRTKTILLVDDVFTTGCDCF